MNEINEDDKKPLDLAIQNNHEKITKLLIREGTVLDAKLKEKVMRKLKISKEELDNLSKRSEESTAQNNNQWQERIRAEVIDAMDIDGPRK